MRHSKTVINRPPASSIPDAPGSYQFVDAGGRVLYVGKAKSLRSRLSNYFADPVTLPARTAQMVALADHVEWIQVASDVASTSGWWTTRATHGWQ
jgi:excinuclease ABC subunit C